MKSIDIEKHNRDTFRDLLDVLSMPGTTKKIEKLFDSYLLSVASVLLYSEVSYKNITEEEFSMIDAITNAKKQEELSQVDYLFCRSSGDALEKLKKGTPLSPELSATIICKVDSFDGLELKLEGPGINGVKKEIYPVDKSFVEQFMKNNKNYPLGNEIYFLNVTTGEIKALSRTTKVEVA